MYHIKYNKSAYCRILYLVAHNVRFPVQSEAQVVMLKEKFALYKHFRKTTEVFSVGSMAIKK